MDNQMNTYTFTHTSLGQKNKNQITEIAWAIIEKFHGFLISKDLLDKCANQKQKFSYVTASNERKLKCRILNEVEQ